MQGGEYVRLYVYGTFVRLNGTYRFFGTFGTDRTSPWYVLVRLNAQKNVHDIFGLDKWK